MKAERRSPPADQRLDELYGERPEAFVAARDRLVKELRAAGDRKQAEAVQRLRRPTVAAWLINLAARDARPPLEQFAEASRQLEATQLRALDGVEGGAVELKASAAAEREAIGAVVAAVRSAAREAGHPASERALELVGETLRAAAGDPDLRERVVQGRLEREQSAATLGTLGTGSPRRRAAAPATRRQDTAARRELDRLEAELADAIAREERARDRVEQIEQMLRVEKERLGDAHREAAELRRKVKAASKRARA